MIIDLMDPEAVALRNARERIAELEGQLYECRVELLNARHDVGEAWFVDGRTLAEAIRAKCTMLEGLGRDDVTPRLRAEWDHDDGPVLWWRFPVAEPPYAGTPLDDDFPEYVTHWTPITVPSNPRPLDDGEPIHELDALAQAYDEAPFDSDAELSTDLAFADACVARGVDPDSYFIEWSGRHRLARSGSDG